MASRKKKVAGLTIKPGQHPQALRKQARKYLLQAQRCTEKALALHAEADKRDLEWFQQFTGPAGAEAAKTTPTQEQAFMLGHLRSSK